MKSPSQDPTANFMTFGVACRAILPHPTGTYLNLPSDWPFHGHQPRSEATIKVKQNSQTSENTYLQWFEGEGAPLVLVDFH